MVQLSFRYIAQDPNKTPTADNTELSVTSQCRPRQQQLCTVTASRRRLRRRRHGLLRRREDGRRGCFGWRLLSSRHSYSTTVGPCGPMPKSQITQPVWNSQGQKKKSSSFTTGERWSNLKAVFLGTVTSFCNSGPRSD